MPTTVNGIGTRYAGRKDESVVQASCSFCGRYASLSSYTTREFFCFLYIPLIPLRRFRIANQCSRCRRHYRTPFEDFQRQIDSEVSPLREAVRRSPNDPEARVALVEALMGFQMFADAEVAAREGAAAAPRHARLNRLTAQLLALRGDLAGATPYYRQAAASAPAEPEIRFALGRHLVLRGEHAEAARELAEARRLDPNNVNALSLLGDSFVALQRWSEALEAYQQILSRRPEAGDRDLLRKMKQCKEALGFPITDAERKAGRRWWPFGGGKPAAPLRPASAVEGKNLVLLIAVVLGVIAVAAVGAGLWRQQRIDLWVDNGLAQPVRVTLDGETFVVPAGPPLRKTVGPGRHAIVVADLQGKEIERADADVPAVDLWDALGTNRFFVYNVAAAHIYRREAIGYAEAAANQTYKASFLALDRFFEQDDVDYIFEPAPETIEVDSHSSATTKVAFNVSPDTTFNGVGVLWFGEGRVEDAERAFRRALVAEPCSPPAWGNLLHILRTRENREDVGKTARSWVDACPARVEAHREYQEAQIALGRRDRMLEEYQARRMEHPEVGANHYLYARLVQDPERSLPIYREAAQHDPNLWWADYAMANNLLTLERPGESLEPLEQALQAPDHDPAIVRLYAMAAVAAGAVERADGRLEAIEKQQKEPDEDLWQARWLLALAAGQYDAAAARLQEHTQAGGESPQDWMRRVQLMRLREDRAGTAKTLAEGRLRPDLAGLAGTLRMEDALGQGRWSEAAAAIDELKPEDISGSDRLYAATAALLSGDRKAAMERLDKLAADLAKAGDDADSAALLAMVQHLEGRAPAAAVLASARRAGFSSLPHAYFMLAAAREAAGDAAGARALYEKSRQCALTFDLPYFAAAARAKG
jgi:tetratricopeptide (TPR) repeat protein